MQLALPILELGDGVWVELLGLFLLQATSTNATRTGIANIGTVDFTGLFSFCSLLLFMFNCQRWVVPEGQTLQASSFAFSIHSPPTFCRCWTMRRLASTDKPWPGRNPARCSRCGAAWWRNFSCLK